MIGPEDESAASHPCAVCGKECSEDDDLCSEACEAQIQTAEPEWECCEECGR